MLKTIELLPGVTLRCYRDHRFKQGCLSLQWLRPMCREEAALNALLPAVLLRGTASAPDLRAITLRLDDLYGASVGALVRRVGDYHTTGLYASFIDDRYAFAGGQVLAEVIRFLGQLLLEPLTEGGAFLPGYVDGEKVNLIAAIESQLNNKQAYANGKMLGHMCRADSFGVPRLGHPEDVEAITPRMLYCHYQKILQESPVEVFYVGSGEPEVLGELLRPLFAPFAGTRLPLPPQTPFHDSPGSHHTQRMDVSQGKLSMGFLTPITIADERFAAMQVANMLLGGGMTGKLFMQLREKLGLCYDISSTYQSAKGIFMVAAGIDPENEDKVRQLVQAQVDCCAAGDFTAQELEAARQALLTGLRGVHDSPGAIEGYYSAAALSLRPMTPAQYTQALEAVTHAQAAEAAATLALHTTYFIRGVQ